MVIENHHRKILLAAVSPIAQGDRNRKQQRLSQQLPRRPPVRIAVTLAPAGELLFHLQEIFRGWRSQRLSRSSLCCLLNGAKSEVANCSYNQVRTDHASFQP